jgi:hypothetical protein
MGARMPLIRVRVNVMGARMPLIRVRVNVMGARMPLIRARVNVMGARIPFVRARILFIRSGCFERRLTLRHARPRITNLRVVKSQMGLGSGWGVLCAERPRARSCPKGQLVVKEKALTWNVASAPLVDTISMP